MTRGMQVALAGVAVALAMMAAAAQAEALAVPAAKAAYVGAWKGQQMELKIEQNGKIFYKRDEPGKRLSVNIELTGFDGDSFRGGLNGPLRIDTTFVVTKPPHKEGGKMKMTVDGIELTRAD